MVWLLHGVCTVTSKEGMQNNIHLSLEPCAEIVDNVCCWNIPNPGCGLMWYCNNFMKSRQLFLQASSVPVYLVASLTEFGGIYSQAKASALNTWIDSTTVWLSVRHLCCWTLMHCRGWRSILGHPWIQVGWCWASTLHRLKWERALEWLENFSRDSKIVL